MRHGNGGFTGGSPLEFFHPLGGEFERMVCELV